MISYEQLLEEMNRQVEIARSTNDEQVIREALTAVKSLCDVLLVERKPTSKIEQPVLAQIPVTPVETKSLSSFEGRPLVEKGANGDSLFEF